MSYVPQGQGPHSRNIENAPTPTSSNDACRHHHTSNAQNGGSNSPRPYQPFVENLVNESRTTYRPYMINSTVSDGQHNSTTHGSFVPFDSTYASVAHANRPYATKAAPASRPHSHACFSPPDLVAEDSSLSSTSSNFLVPTPRPFQGCSTRSSQKPSSEWNTRDVPARSNKPMSAGRASAVFSSRGEGDNSALRSTPCAIHSTQFTLPREHLGKYHSGVRPANLFISSDWYSIQNQPPLLSAQYDPFTPPQSSAPYSQLPSFRSATQGHSPELYPRAQDSPSHATFCSPRAIDTPIAEATVREVRNAPDGAPFEIHLRSELNRRKIADKTICNIRSMQAKALAQSKENARRADWARDVLLKFPTECGVFNNVTLS